VALKVPCPFCGERPFSEFTFGGELRPIDAPTPELDFERVYLRRNAPAIQEERWFHAAGCRRWFQVRRDTATNGIERDG
jgi:heterotetrameric sarcosine oxidase delta subunit